VLSYVVTWPHAQDIYYWQVRAIDAVGNTSDWTSASSLIIEAGMSSASVKPKATPIPTIAPTFAPPTKTPAAPNVSEIPAASTVEAESSSVMRSGSWTVQNANSASGGKYIYSSGQNGDVLTVGFSGTHVDIVFVKNPAFGSFPVEVDGALLQTVDARAEQTMFG